MSEDSAHLKDITSMQTPNREILSFTITEVHMAIFSPRVRPLALTVLKLNTSYTRGGIADTSSHSPFQLYC